jgi:cytochrome c oxidase subunit 3
MPDVRPALQFSDLRQQHETAEAGMWAFLATEALFFGGALLAYAVYRHAYPEGFADAARHTRMVIGTINTAMLLTSSFLVAWAATVTRMGAGRLAGALCWGAAALGLVFLVLKGVEYHSEYTEHLIPGLNIDPNRPKAGAISLFFAFYFVTTGLHAVHLAIGVVVLIVLGGKARTGAYSSAYHSPMTVGALYWHFIDVVWIFLFALIYLPGRAS